MRRLSKAVRLAGKAQALYEPAAPTRDARERCKSIALEGEIASKLAAEYQRLAQIASRLLQ